HPLGSKLGVGAVKAQHHHLLGHGVCGRSPVATCQITQSCQPHSHQGVEGQPLRCVLCVHHGPVIVRSPLPSVERKLKNSDEWRVTSDERTSEHCLLRLLLSPQQIIGEVPNLGAAVFVQGCNQACELG